MKYEFGHVGGYFNGKTKIWGYIYDKDYLLKYNVEHCIFWGSFDVGFHFKEVRPVTLKKTLKEKRKKYTIPINDEQRQKIMLEFEMYKVCSKLKQKI